MAYVKLAPLSLFLLATFLMFTVKNVEADCATYRLCTFGYGCDSGCICLPPAPIPAGKCIAFIYKDAVKTLGKNSKICRSDDECKTQGFGSYCALSINPEGDYGWCFASKSEAEEILSKPAAASKATTFAEDFLRMPMNIA